MQTYEMTPEEREYLKHYNIADFARPSIATDVAVFSVLADGERTDIRRLQKKQLKVLLIRRANFPYRGSWSMPGGFCVPGEDVQATARRELLEETNVSDAYLKLVGVYGEKDRDPRGWIISNTFMTLIDGESACLRAGTDAWEARWFNVTLTHEGEDGLLHRMTFSNAEAGLTLTALVREERSISAHHAASQYILVESDGIAFDHGGILVEALERLRSDVGHDMRPIFDLMPARFTLTDLQTAYELVTGQDVAAANFRRKAAPYVTSTGEMTGGEGFRPAMLYERNMEALG